MSHWMEYVIAGASFVLMLMGVGMSLVMPGADSWSRRFFILVHLILAICIGASIVDMIIYAKPEFVQAEVILVYVEFLLFSILDPMMTAYLLHCCGESWKSSPLFYWATALWSVFFILLWVAQFTTCFYTTSPESLFCRGPWYILLILPLILLLILNLLALLYKRERLSRKYLCAFLIYDLVSMLVTSVQMLFSSLTLVVAGVSICSIAMNFIILLDQAERYMNQRQEIARQRANIMVLQMRPHYIYNTMSSIYQLCAQDSHKAQQVTLDFTTYLRKNFSAIASENVIPFNEELEHTRAYLSVEKAQYEERLFVEYDLAYTMFRLPPLTLQPIVEIAVRYGLTPQGAPLRIAIRTRELEGEGVIMVEDDGPGFDGEDVLREHSTLANIKQRLELMCHGKLEIKTGRGGPTLIKVTIPNLKQAGRNAKEGKQRASFAKYPKKS